MDLTLKGVTLNIVLLLASLGWATDHDSNGQPATHYADGYFTYPRVFGDRFPVGTSINASWITNYTNINLFYVQYGKQFLNPVMLLSVIIGPSGDDGKSIPIRSE